MSSDKISNSVVETYEFSENRGSSLPREEPSVNFKESDENTIQLFENNIKEYIEKNNPKVYILTPCYGAKCFVNYVQSLMLTITVFHKYGLKYQVEFVKNDSLISRARNNLVAKAMADPEMTHILFIDSDITWRPMDIFHLILSDKPLIGAIYPLKSYRWERLTTENIQLWSSKKKESVLKDALPDTRFFYSKLMDYNVNYIDSLIKLENNLTEVKHLPTGFMMIKRTVIDKMSKAFPSTKYDDDIRALTPEENKYAFALFDCAVEDGHYMSEDWLFCSRWRKMGGNIWINVAIELLHTGIEDYSGFYLSTIIL
jgi:hypothetical protein